MGSLPFPAAGIVTAAISLSKRPRSRADAAFRCDATANASWSSRVTPYFSATFSAVWPIESMPKQSRIFGFTNRHPMLVSNISTLREKGWLALAMTKGARVMCSTPPAM